MKKLVQQLNSAHPNLRADIARRLLIACEDPEEHVKTIAIEYVFPLCESKQLIVMEFRLWPQTRLSVQADDVKDFLKDIIKTEQIVREAATQALPKLLENTHRPLVPFILSDLFEIYAKNNKVCSVYHNCKALRMNDFFSFHHRLSINSDDNFKLNLSILGNLVLVLLDVYFIWQHWSGIMSKICLNFMFQQH